MRDFLHRRASLLIEEAKRLASEKAGHEACQRVLATCDFINDSFGKSHRELPELFQLLSDLHERLGESREAERYQILSWELERFRKRRYRRLLAISHLSGVRLQTAFESVSGSGSADVLRKRFRDETFLENAPEILVIGPSGSGKTHLIHSLGIEALDHPWPTRLYMSYEFLEILARARRMLHLHRELLRLDRYLVLIIDEFDPWSLNQEESEVFHAALLHRRDRRCTVLAIQTKQHRKPADVLAALRQTRALRKLSSGVVLVELDGENFR